MSPLRRVDVNSNIGKHKSGNPPQKVPSLHVVLVQGHPAVGKTSLLSLLYHHIDSLSDPHLRLFQFFSWNKESVERAGGWRKYIYEMTDQDLDLNATVLQPYLILLDEAQVSYRDEDFWAEYVKVVAQDQRG